VTENLLSATTLPQGAFGIQKMEPFRQWLMILKDCGETMEDIDRNIVAITFNGGTDIVFWNMRGAEGYEE